MPSQSTHLLMSVVHSNNFRGNCCKTNSKWPRTLHGPVTHHSSLAAPCPSTPRFLPFPEPPHSFAQTLPFAYRVAFMTLLKIKFKSSSVQDAWIAKAERFGLCLLCPLSTVNVQAVPHCSTVPPPSDEEQPRLFSIYPTHVLVSRSLLILRPDLSGAPST